LASETSFRVFRLEEKADAAPGRFPHQVGAIQQAGQAEVNDGQRIVFVHEKVPWVDITMQNVLSV